jgi:hypothetical protein
MDLLMKRLEDKEGSHATLQISHDLWSVWKHWTLRESMSSAGGGRELHHHQQQQPISSPT